MKPEISVVMPVYNVEKYLKKCVKSIIKQSFQNWELIAVNDCSPDNSRAILSRYVEKDNRIRVIDHPANRGASQARFTGLDHAQGKYIVFVDSDDWMPPKALELLYYKIEEEEADIVIGSTSKVIGRFGISKTKPKNIYSQENQTESITMPELFDKYYLSYFGVSLLPVNIWGRIYSRKIIDKASPKSVPFIIGEDMVFNIMLHPFLSKIGFITNRIYNYRYGGGAYLSRPDLMNVAKELYFLKEENIRKHNYSIAIPYIKVELINFFYTHFLYQVLINKKSFSEIRKLIEDELKDNVYNENLFEGITLSEKANALKLKDIDNILAIIRKNVRKEKPRYLTMQFIARLLG